MNAKILIAATMIGLPAVAAIATQLEELRRGLEIDPDAFREMGRRFLQLPIGEVERVEIATLEAAAA